MDIYLIKYIESFLKKCDKCKKLDIYDINQKCNICSSYYCSECENMKKVHGFFSSSYCNFCHKCFFREFIP